MTIAIKPTASGSTIEQNGSTILTVDSSGNIAIANDLSVTGTFPTSTPDALSTASGSAPSYSARAWANFSGTGTPTLRSSGNVTSITDHGTGDYSINFTTSMPDVNYCANVTIPAENHYCTGIGTGGGVGSPTSSYGTSAFRTGTIRSQGGAVFDPAYINIAIFR